MKTDVHGNIHLPAGVQGAGQFNGRVNTAPAGTLTATPAVAGSIVTLVEAKREQLIQRGYAPATAGFSMAGSVRGTDTIDTWWGEQFLHAEVTTGDQAYAIMPDDYTPKNTRGRALSGNRRTHRILYTGQDVAVRMPSASSIKRYSAELGGQTFDVPIQIEGKAGRPYSGYVRVTQTGPNSWSTTALGMPPQIAAQAAEAVNAILEARRPSVGLREAGDLLERRRQRAAATGARMEAVEGSTFIQAVGYNREAGEIIVNLNGRTYGYEAPEAAWELLRNASSPGKMYNAHIKGRTRVPVAQCDLCKRWFNEDRGHACTGHRPRGSVVPLFNRRLAAFLINKKPKTGKAAPESAAAPAPTV